LLLLKESILGIVSFGMGSLSCATAFFMEPKGTMKSNNNRIVESWNDLSLKICECAKLNLVTGSDDFKDALIKSSKEISAPDFFIIVSMFFSAAALINPVIPLEVSW